MKSIKPIKIVIADDSTMFIEGIKALLRSAGRFEILDIYDNGEDLVASRSINIADVVLVDINMPKLDGLQAAQQINFQNAKIPLIAVTMHKDDVYLQDIIGVGFKAFVYKPNVATDLLTTIDKVLNDEFVFPTSLRM